MEITLAFNCLLDSLGSTDILNPNIDTLLCRKLIQEITHNSKDEAKESLIKLCALLNVNVLTDESALSNDLPVDSRESSPILRGEALSIKLSIGNWEVTDGLLSMLRIGGQRVEDALFLYIC